MSDVTKKGTIKSVTRGVGGRSFIVTIEPVPEPPEPPEAAYGPPVPDGFADDATTAVAHGLEVSVTSDSESIGTPTQITIHA